MTEFPELSNSYRDPEPEPEPTRTCEECRWCLEEDYGYSNYTVEGTQVYCLMDLHPSGPEGFDRWFKEDDRIRFATNCVGFTEGQMVEVDCDRDAVPLKDPGPWWHYYTKDEAQRALIARREASL